MLSRSIVATLTLFTLHAVFAAETTITVEAGKFDRKDCIVTFALPDGVGEGACALRDAAGAVIPLQVDARRQAAFLLTELKANQSRTYTIVANADVDARTPSVAVVTAGTALDFSIAGKKVISYQFAKSEPPKGLVDAKGAPAVYGPEYARGGYVFPVLTPSGKLVTDDYPPNHKHHHSVWMAWTKTEFGARHPDFWNMGGKTGTVEAQGLWSAELAGKFFPASLNVPEFAAIPFGRAFWSGPVHGGCEAFHTYIDLGDPKAGASKPVEAIYEHWKVNVYNLGASNGKYRIFDVITTQRCASSEPLKLPKYHYGGLGLRGNRAWDGKDNAVILSAEGKGRDANATGSRWLYMGGKVDGATAGIVMMDHPSNFRSPQPMRVHPTEPFVGYAPMVNEPFEITPGKAYVARYRIVATDGEPDPTELDRLWNDFANPPTVTVK